MIKFIKVDNHSDAIDQALRNNGGEGVVLAHDNHRDFKSLSGVKRSVSAFWGDCPSNDYVAALVQSPIGKWSAYISVVAA